VSVVADEMMSKGLKAVLVLATDGLPTTRQGLNSKAANDEFIGALRQLQTLPIWLVVRLFTNEEEVVDFYNGLDAQLEMNLVSVLVLVPTAIGGKMFQWSNCFVAGHRKY
jgi:hypothetical protein